MVQHADIDHTGLTGVGETGTAAHIADATDAHDASAISVLDTAANFTGTDVEAVLAELQDNIDGVSGGALDYIKIEDQKAQNTAGGTFTSGAWQTRVLNTEVTDTGSHASLASNQITLAAGTYYALISCPAQYCDAHQARLQNVTAGTTLILGQNQYSSNDETDVISTVSLVRGVFTVAGSQALEVQHRCTTTRNTNGWGTATNWGTEVYTVAEFWKRS